MKPGFAMTVSRGRHTREDGQALVLMGLMMAGMLGMLALVTDVGFLYAESRSAQAAADAAALAAAQHRLKVPGAGTATLTSTARSYASASGFTNGASGTTVTVNVPPTSGSHTINNANEYYIEVVIQRQLPGFFSGTVFGGLVQAQASAVAGVIRQPAPYGVIALRNDCSDEALEVENSAQIIVNNGAVLVNSCDPSSALEVENSGSITATYAVDVVGGFENTGTISPSPTTGASPVLNPLGDIPPPSVTTNCGPFKMEHPNRIDDPSINSPNDGGPSGCIAKWHLDSPCSKQWAVLEPGIYAELEVECGTVWLKPGTYVLQGDGLEVKNATFRSCRNPPRPGQTGDVATACGSLATSDGVLIYSSTESYPSCGGDNAEIEIETTSVFEIQAATTGTYAGLAILGDPCSDDDDEGLEIENTSTVTIDGTVYLPHAEAEIENNASTVTINGGFYVKTLEMENSSVLTVNYNSGGYVYKPPVAVLVE